MALAGPAAAAPMTETESGMQPDPRTLIAALRQSHERLLRLVAPLGPEQLRSRSYCRDWTIAQVLSHLGSGAEIAARNLPAALGQAEALAPEAYQPVWDRWDAMSPEDQAAAALLADAQHVQMLDGLGDDDLKAISLSLFGMTLDAAGLVRLRLAEHALHTWDVAVALDPAATVDPVAVSLLIDATAPLLAGRSGKPQGTGFRARIRTAGPDREYLLEAAEPVRLAPAGPEAAAAAEVDVAMPAEALLRLVAGRMDAAHTPDAVTGAPADLDRLRAIFPGY